MVTDNQRREVAQELRKLTAPGCIRYAEEFYEELREIVARDLDGSFEGVANSLANLIEPQHIDGNTSDGYHTFNELYHHRAVLFSVIVENFAARAWKSKLHADGTMYEGMFIVGIETPDGQATYHYDVEPYWNLFRCKEVDRAPEWDGHTPDQAIERIGKLVDCKPDRPTCKFKPAYGPDLMGEVSLVECTACAWTIEPWIAYEFRYCPMCGAEVLDEDSPN